MQLFFKLMLELSPLIELLSKPRKIVITTHHKPDGDAMGSSLGLYNFLIQHGHDAAVITPTDYPDFLHWLPGNNEVIIFTEHEDASAVLVAEAEIIFCLDFNTLSRINALGELVRASNAVKIMIDHHLDPEDFDDFRYLNTNACATAQLVYDFIKTGLNQEKLINKDVATCLYTGIMTDSGSFRLPNTTAEVHRIVANLIEAGAVNWKIHELVFNNSSENRLKFLGYCLNEKLEVLSDFNTSVISISRAELDKYDVMTGDTEGIVNYGLSITGIRLTALIVERKDMVKLSLRSTGDFPASEICKKYFNGGGHLNAAGGHSDDTLENVVKKFKEVLPLYKI